MVYTTYSTTHSSDIALSNHSHNAINGHTQSTCENCSMATMAPKSSENSCYFCRWHESAMLFLYTFRWKRTWKQAKAMWYNHDQWHVSAVSLPKSMYNQVKLGGATLPKNIDEKGSIYILLHESFAIYCDSFRWSILQMMRSRHMSW